ncbi:MAG: hypothetical protein PVI57_13115 [Gemmatimonadota bacterium]
MLISVVSVALVGALGVSAGGGGPADTLSAQARLRLSAPPTTLLAPSPGAAVRLSVPGELVPMTVRRTPGAPDGEGDDAAPQLIEYSDGYFTRLTIHRWASYLTLPLFVGQYVVGQKLIDGEGSGSLRSAHGALAAGIGGLFVVNTITGGLNAIEGWKDPADRNRRTLHSVLMLLADAGFVATGALANESEEGGSGNNNTHRNVALASMGTALLGYAIMLPIFGRD